MRPCSSARRVAFGPVSTRCTFLHTALICSGIEKSFVASAKAWTGEFRWDLGTRGWPETGGNDPWTDVGEGIPELVDPYDMGGRVRWKVSKSSLLLFTGRSMSHEVFIEQSTLTEPDGRLACQSIYLHACVRTRKSARERQHRRMHG